MQSGRILQVSVNRAVYQGDFLRFRTVSGTAVPVNQIYAEVFRPVGTSLDISCGIVVVDSVSCLGRRTYRIFLGEGFRLNRNVLGKFIQFLVSLIL